MRPALTAFGAIFAIFLGFGFHPNLSPNSQTTAQQTAAPAPARFAFGGNAAEVPAEFVGNLIFVPLDINKSQPSLFVLDSSPAPSSVSPTRAADLRLSSLKDPILNFPGVDYPFLNFPILDKQDFSQEGGRPYKGTRGADFL